MDAGASTSRAIPGTSSGSRQLERQATSSDRDRVGSVRKKTTRKTRRESNMARRRPSAADFWANFNYVDVVGTGDDHVSRRRRREQRERKTSIGVTSAASSSPGTGIGGPGLTREGSERSRTGGTSPSVPRQRQQLFLRHQQQFQQLPRQSSATPRIILAKKQMSLDDGLRTTRGYRRRSSTATGFGVTSLDSFDNSLALEDDRSRYFHKRSIDDDEDGQPEEKEDEAPFDPRRPYPDFAFMSFNCLEQTTPLRQQCIRMIMNPYPFS